MEAKTGRWQPTDRYAATKEMLSQPAYDLTNLVSRFEAAKPIMDDLPLAGYDQVMSFCQTDEERTALMALGSITPDDLGIPRFVDHYPQASDKFIALDQHYTGPDGVPRNPNIKYLPEHVKQALDNMNASYQAFLNEKGITNRPGLVVASGYRSPAYQLLALAESVHSRGFDIGLMNTALPFNSEHGDPVNTAVDFICLGDENGKKPVQNRPVVFELTIEFDWLLYNAAQHGFALTLPPDMNDPTSGRTESGFEYEPWHWRYLGDQAAAFMAENQVTERVAARRQAIASYDYQELLDLAN